MPNASLLKRRKKKQDKYSQHEYSSISEDARWSVGNESPLQQELSSHAWS